MKPWFLSILIPACLLIGCPSSTFTQSLVDSLSALLVQATDQRQLELLNELAWELKYNDPMRAKGYAESALQQAAQTNDRHQAALASRNLGAIAFLLSDYPSAIGHLEKALEEFRALSDQYMTAKTLNLLAITHRDFETFEQSIEYQNQALSLFEALDDTLEISGNLNNLALTYAQLNILDKALGLYHQVLNYEEMMGNKTGLARTSNNIASIYQSMGDYDQAIAHVNRGISLSRETGNLNFEAAGRHMLAGIYLDLEETDSARQQLYMAIEITEKTDNKNFKANCLTVLGDVEKASNLPDQAIGLYLKAADIYRSIQVTGPYLTVLHRIASIHLERGNKTAARILLDEAFSLAGEADDAVLMMGLNRTYYNLCKAEGRSSEAYAAIEQYLAFRDSADRSSLAKKLKELSIRYEVEKIQTENQWLVAEAEAKNKQIRFQRLAMLGTAALLMLTLVIVWLVINNRNRLRKANASKEKLLSILAHDLRSPFSSLMGLSQLLTEELTASRLMDLAKYASALNRTAEDTHGLLQNLLEWSLSQKDKIYVEKKVTELHDFIIDILKSAQARADEKNIRLIVEVDRGTQVSCDQNILGTVIRNLLTNAIKFTHDGGEVIISAALKPGGFDITIKDNGVGIPAEKLENLFSLQNGSTNGTKNERGAGLGLVLCHDLSEKIDCRIEVTSAPGQGSSFTLHCHH